MGIYEKILRPALFRLDAEQAHHFAASFLPFAGLAGGAWKVSDSALQTRIAGTQVANPVGLAAGFDKNGHFVAALAQFGFGFAEVGSITGRPSAGNPKPRLFRLPADAAIINRMGLNGDGADVVAERLRHAHPSIPFAVNIAKTNDPAIQGEAGIADQIHSFQMIRDLPLAYVAINASCPNTHEGCLQAKDELDTLLAEIQKANNRGLPLFLKLSPDSSDSLLEEFVATATDNRLAGFVCGNTTVDRSGLQTDNDTVVKIGNGGLSGAPLKQKALNLVSRAFRLKSAEQQIIGCGGIATGADAMAFIRAGASAIQIYTSFVYHGPSTVAQINRELAAILRQEKIALKDCVGLAHEPGYTEKERI